MIEIRKAERAQSKLRVGLAGPSGAGKTMSALKLARGIVGPEGKIIMIDTERGSGDLYAHITPYDIITLKPPYNPKNYVEAIEAAEDAGYDVIIVDSLSHAWSDEGGLLDQADKLSAGGNRFTVWSSLTPQHRKLVNGMLNSDCHIIATVRSKQEYAMEKDEKTGRSSVKKMGMAPVQRDGMEYEFTVFMDIEQNHSAHVSKDRTALFDNEVFLIDESIGQRLVSWLNEAKPVVGHLTNAELRKKEKLEAIEQAILAKKKRIVDLLSKLETVNKDTIVERIKALTQCDLVEANYEEIANRLSIVVSERSSTNNAKA